MATGRPPLGGTCARVPASISTPLPSPALPRRLKAGVSAATATPSICNASFPKTQLLDLLQHSLVLFIALVPPSQLGQHIVAWSVLVTVCPLLGIALSTARVCLEENVQQSGDGGVGLGGAHRGAA